MKRFLGIGLTAILLAACSHDKPALTPDRIQDNLRGNVKVVSLNYWNTKRTCKYDEHGFYTFDGNSYYDMSSECTYEYSKPGIRSKHNQSLDGNNPAPVTYDYTFDKDGRPISSIVNIAGAKTQNNFIYDSEGNLRRITSSDINMQQIVDLDANGFRKMIDITYNADPDPKKCPGKTQNFSYNKAGDMVSEKTVYRNTPKETDLTCAIVYTITKRDEQGNWIERKAHATYRYPQPVNTPIDYTQTRNIIYF